MHSTCMPHRALVLKTFRKQVSFTLGQPVLSVFWDEPQYRDLLSPARVVLSSIDSVLAYDEYLFFSAAPTTVVADEVNAPAAVEPRGRWGWRYFENKCMVEGLKNCSLSCGN